MGLVEKSVYALGAHAAYQEALLLVTEQFLGPVGEAAVGKFMLGAVVGGGIDMESCQLIVVLYCYLRGVMVHLEVREARCNIQPGVRCSLLYPFALADNIN